MQNSKSKYCAICKSKVRKIFILRHSSFIPRYGGFTLLEVLVATAILAIAVAVILQLFSANLRAISLSGDYVSAATEAESRMREILDDDKLSEKSFSEITDEGYRIDVSVTEALKDRTENLQVKLLQIDLTIRWVKGPEEKSLTLSTLKIMKKEVL
jgi:type II secretion system protein I